MLWAGEMAQWAKVLDIKTEFNPKDPRGGRRRPTPLSFHCGTHSHTIQLKFFFKKKINGPFNTP